MSALPPKRRAEVLRRILKRSPLRADIKQKLVAVEADCLVEEMAVATGNSEADIRSMLFLMAAAGLAVVRVEK